MRPRTKGGMGMWRVFGEDERPDGFLAAAHMTSKLAQCGVRAWRASGKE
jgi:hypothetical protein